MPVPTSRARLRLAVPLAVFGVLGLAACGQATAGAAAAPSTTGSTAGPGQPATDGADATGREAFRTCLAENGVTLPERGGDRPQPPNGSAPDGSAPNGSAPNGSAPDDSAPTDGSPSGDAPSAPPGAAADGSAPDAPPPAAGSPVGGDAPAPPGVDATTWAAAREACADLLPTPTN